MIKLIQYGSGLLCGCLVACAGAPPPHEREASSEAAIRSAQELGADQVPEAALHLKLAQEQFDKGKSLMNDGDNKRADYVLLRAQADAELALAMARETKVRVEAQQMVDKVRAARAPGMPLPAPSSPAQSSNPMPTQNPIQ